ncbi:T9SS-dependent choice-of-anchor J family protein [Deminuibacter soli]|uniref:T9SS C-terminal target domain-containing protein n=1 Tax=Deminuibacter soli TaxID=2291815 RepID=A0A3E1NJL8_9BACT|nr:choice-of-anchor J domain-containing protein [Deminuibacter soli]RFM28014.1 T9SS C-terminal target domain-containing protein [Deminuibacter soli]
MPFKQVLAAVLTLLSVQIFAQKQPSANHITRRCATMEVMQNMLRNNPDLKNQWKAESERLLEQYRNSPASRETFPTGTIVVPIVVHIITNNPASISDRDVLDQIEILNTDYAGANIDTSFLTPEFKARFGRTHIRFVMARRTPAGALTNGIERKTTSATFTSNTSNAVKHVAQGGLDAWDVNNYFNIWVANFTDGLLGISTFPYMTPASEQGVVINNIGFGINPCHVDPRFNLGRTLVHETGHYFYLYHVWGDDQLESNTCSESDFTTETGADLPAACTDDTPNQGVSSSGFLAGYVIDNCSTAKPGINYQNYMDYTNDVSYGMFTANQVCRMHAALDLYRSSLKASAAASAPGTFTDAYLVALQPGGSACGVVPVVAKNTNVITQLRNAGNTTLTSVNFTVQYDGSTATTVGWSGKLAPGHDTLVNLGPITAAQGAHTLTVFTTTPNGGADGYVLNDTIVKQITVAQTAIAAPFTESFEGTSFPPQGWTVSNPDNSAFTWVRASGAGATGTKSAVVQNYVDSLDGEWDDLITPPIDFGVANAATLTFQVAYRQLNQNGYVDGLDIWVSGDGGLTYQPAYRKSSPDLSTVAGTTPNSFVPTATQWRKETVDLTPFLVQGQKMQILFRNIAGWGNNLYIDDIQVTKNSQTQYDIAIKTLSAPPFTCTGTSITPAVTLFNNGTATLTSATLHYAVDNATATAVPWQGNLAPNDSIAVSLQGVSGSLGQHTLLVYTTSPNGNADQLTSNDTASQGFAITGLVNAPVYESFESTVPPAGWGIYNPDNSITWAQTTKTNGNNASQDSHAAYMNNFAYTGSGNIDELRSPTVQYGTVDSVFVVFDVAAAHTPIISVLPGDTLQVFITSDCGNTLQKVYEKYGTTLQTAGSTPAGGAVFVPSQASQYRRDSINLTSIVPLSGGSFQVVFRNVSNGRNNIYIDSVQIYTKSLPAKLKEQGYLIYPNPFQTWFAVQHLKAPTNLQGIEVFDAAGRRIYSSRYSSNAPSYITVNLGNVPHGMYFVQLVYLDHKVTERVLR